MYSESSRHKEITDNNTGTTEVGGIGRPATTPTPPPQK